MCHYGFNSTREYSLFFSFCTNEEKNQNNFKTFWFNHYSKITDSSPHAQVKAWEVFLTSSPYHESIVNTCGPCFLNTSQICSFLPTSTTSIPGQVTPIPRLGSTSRLLPGFSSHALLGTIQCDHVSLKFLTSLEATSKLFTWIYEPCRILP